MAPLKNKIIDPSTAVRVMVQVNNVHIIRKYVYNSRSIERIDSRETQIVVESIDSVKALS